MTAKQVRRTNPHATAEFTQLFGPPPLFKSEDKRIYVAILEGLAQEERPRSFIARILLRDVADLVYQRLWLRSLGGQLLRQAHRAKIGKDAAALREIMNFARRPSSGPDNEARIKRIDASEKKQLARLAKAKDGPVDEAAAFPGWIENYERVQSLLAASDKRLSDTLKLLDQYRDGLGRRVRQVADEIVDVEFEESSLPGPEQQVATPASSIAAVEPAVPSTQAMLPSPAAENVASPVEVSASLRPASSKQRRRLHSAGIQRGRRSAPSTPSRARSNTRIPGDTEAGKVAASANTRRTAELGSTGTEV